MDLPHRPYQRILLKISGEALGGGQRGFDPATARTLIQEIKSVIETGIQVALVCGGGNIFRGINADQFRIDRVKADAMGMLATMINGIALEEFCRNEGLNALAMSAWSIPGVLPEFSASTARKALSEGSVVICCGGTGWPYFSTDTAAALRALEIGADILIKGTKVDGVYAGDPVKNPEAEFISRITHDAVIDKKLKVMDLTSIALCRENQLPVRIFNMTVPGNLLKIANGGDIGTLVS
jgi:uridylate kinase